MNLFSDIESSFEMETLKVENDLELAEMTIAYGLHFFQYESSHFIEELFENLDLNTSEKIFYDLGSGYGKVILYGAYHNPKARFKGIEVVEERNRICNQFIEKLNLTNITTYTQDIFKYDLSDGDVFYIFNPFFGQKFYDLVEKLREVASQKEIIVVAEHRCDVFDLTDWLHSYKEILDPIHVGKKVKFYKSDM